MEQKNTSRFSNRVEDYVAYRPGYPDEIIATVRTALKSRADEKTLESSQRFFKESVQSYGVKVPVVQQISKSCFRQLSHLSKAEVFDLCEILWQSGYIEESFVACHWSYAVRKQYEATDFAVFEHWINEYVSNWASCDTLCNHTVGTLLEMFPECIDRLKQLTSSENRWMKRAAAVSLIIPARKGLFLQDVFEIADSLLGDSDDLVQKGYGWMLKAAGEAHQQEVFTYVMQNKKGMPRTALRYAIEKMPVELRKRAMER